MERAAPRDSGCYAALEGQDHEPERVVDHLQFFQRRRRPQNGAVLEQPFRDLGGGPGPLGLSCRIREREVFGPGPVWEDR
eukprot:7291661-Alexandrium_andersonii.AAC.1